MTQGQYNRSGESRASRSLMLSVTDGVQTVEAMETQPISCLPDLIKPGMKIQVTGPLTARRGILMLQSNSVRVLGGEVDELAEEFSLQKILQQKIGKDDVGQKESRFAAASTVRDPPPPPRPSVRPSASVNPRIPQQVEVPQHTANNVPEDFFEDDDDDMMLLAASQMDDNLEQQAASQVSASSASTSSVWDRTQARQGGSSSGVSGPPVGVVQPLRTITNSSSVSQSRKMIAQSSITSFMTNKTSEPVATSSSSNAVTFSLLDSDDEFLADFQYEEAVAVKTGEASEAPSEPFQYLVNFNERVRASPNEIIMGKFKVVSSTLAGKMSLNKCAAGPEWNVLVLLNDGSDAIKVDISPVMLDVKLGRAADYAKSNEPSYRAKYKQNIKEFSKSLANLNGIVTIQSGGREDSVARIIDIEEISGKHLAAMIKRSKLYQ